MKSESVSELKTLFNSTIDAIDSLKLLNSPVEHWDHILVPMIVQRLDQKSFIAWEDSVKGSTKPSKFSELIQKRLLAMEAVQDTSSSRGSQPLKFSTLRMTSRIFLDLIMQFKVEKFLSGCNAVFASNRITYLLAVVSKINL